jgi:hypothetical protein
MKDWNVLILIVLSLAISVTMYYQETVKQQHEIDAIKKGFSGAASFFQPNSNISFKGEPSKLELYMWSRYILAPRFISYNHDTDTVLSIQYLQNGDSSLMAFVSGRDILYQKSDSQYRYLVTITPNNDSGK